MPFDCAEILSSRKVHIWAWCEVALYDHLPYSCPSCCVLRICCEETCRWLCWSLGVVYHGRSCCFYTICKCLLFFFWKLTKLTFCKHDFKVLYIPQVFYGYIGCLCWWNQNKYCTFRSISYNGILWLVSCSLVYIFFLLCKYCVIYSAVAFLCCICIQFEH